MRTRSMVVAGAMALVVAGAFAGISLAGGSKQGSTPDPRIRVLKPVTAVAAPDGTSAAVAKPKHHKHKKKPTIQYFYASNATVPPEGGGIVQGLRCPKGKGEPVGGGAQTDVGIVVSYLSRIKPASNGKTPRRTYYVGVDDNVSDDPAQEGAGARIEIQCAKDIKVKHG